jgi:hypothetical protein
MQAVRVAKPYTFAVDLTALNYRSITSAKSKGAP